MLLNPVLLPHQKPPAKKPVHAAGPLRPSFKRAVADQSLWGSAREPTNHPKGLTTVLALEIRQRFLVPFFPALLFVQENRQRPEQGEVPCCVALPDGAPIFILGSISAMMLAVFDRPMSTSQILQPFWTGLGCPQTGHPECDFLGVFDHPTAAHRIDYALDADNLCGSGQSQGRRVSRTDPQTVLLNPSVAFLDRLICRGEMSPTGVVGPWPERGVGCP